MNLIEVYNLLLSLQCNFNKDICDKIFKNDSDHLYIKWLQCNGNMLNFITRLDKMNQILLFNYAML